ncbi:MAG: hypothetical protein U0M06_14145 [Clostridia bacterium]|nr:hypothetical protein [Clostridia bacterium]
MIATENESIISAVKEFFYRLLYGESQTQYENFSFGNPIVTYRIVIIAIAAGLVIASAVMIYKRKVLGRFVRALNDAGASSKESAKRMDELDFKHSLFISFSLKRGTLARMVSSVQKDCYNEKFLENTENEEKDGKDNGKKKRKKVVSEFVPDPESDSYYLPEDDKKRSAMLTLFSDKGSGIFSFLLTLFACVAASALLFYAVPWFIGLLDSTL